MDFPELDEWGRPLAKLPNCPRCGEDELAVIHDQLLLCYACNFRVEGVNYLQETCLRDAAERLRDLHTFPQIPPEAAGAPSSPTAPGVAGAAFAPRSPGWRKVREEFVKNNPKCSCCGSLHKLEVHHIQPFHLFPEKELDPTNLLTLCSQGPAGMNCHLLVGHCGVWADYNPSAVTSASYLARMLRNKKDG